MDFENWLSMDLLEVVQIRQSSHWVRYELERSEWMGCWSFELELDGVLVPLARPVEVALAGRVSS